MSEIVFFEEHELITIGKPTSCPIHSWRTCSKRWHQISPPPLTVYPQAHGEGRVRREGGREEGGRRWREEREAGREGRDGEKQSRVCCISDDKSRELTDVLHSLYTYMYM